MFLHGGATAPERKKCMSSFMSGSRSFNGAARTAPSQIGSNLLWVLRVSSVLQSNRKTPGAKEATAQDTRGLLRGERPDIAHRRFPRSPRHFMSEFRFRREAFESCTGAGQIGTLSLAVVL